MKVKKRFANVNRPLTPEEERALAEAIELEGVTDPVILWNDWIVDGHNRRRIANRLGMADDDIPQVQKDFEDEDEAEEWIIRRQLARRNLNPHDFKVFIGKLYNATKQDAGGDRKSKGQNVLLIGETAEEIGNEHGVSEKTVKRAGKVAEAHAKLTDAGKILYSAGKLTDSQVEKLASKSADKQNQISRQIRTGQKTAKDLLETKSKPVDLARKNRQLAHEYRDKLARAICDYHEVKPNRKERDRLVKLIQGVTLW